MGSYFMGQGYIYNTLFVADITRMVFPEEHRVLTDLIAENIRFRLGAEWGGSYVDNIFMYIRVGRKN